MAKLKLKKNRLGSAPTAEQIKENLDKPEIAPTAPEQKQQQKPTSKPKQKDKPKNSMKKQDKSTDGRTLRKTGFSHQLNVKVPTGFKEEVLELSKNSKMTLGKFLVEAVECYKREAGKGKNKR
jgi:hypothetical protein